MKTVKLSEITNKIGSGATPNGGSSVYSDNGISFIRSQNVLDMAFSKNGLVFLNEQQANELRNVTIESSDILLNITGDSIARSCVVPENILPARVNQHVSIIRCKDKNDSEYLGFYLQYLKPYLLKICRVGGTRNALTKESIGKLPILYPDNRQEKVKILTLINQKIAVNNQINAQLEQMAKTLYDYWFVQFDFPDENDKPYQSSGGEMVYNDTLKRNIPKGWEVKYVSDYCKIFTGKKDVNQSKEFGKYKFYSCSPNYRFSDEKLFEGKAILVSGNGSYTGRTIFVNDAFDLYQRTYAIVNNLNFNFLEYIFHSMKTFFVPKVSGGTHGSAIPYIVLNDIAKQTIVFHANTVNHFLNIVSNIQDVIISNEKQNQQLTQLRDFLLPMLMNGQVIIEI